MYDRLSPLRMPPVVECASVSRYFYTCTLFTYRFIPHALSHRLLTLTHSRTPFTHSQESERRRLYREAQLALNREVTTFEPPLAHHQLRVLVNGEITRAVGFDDAALYVQVCVDRSERERERAVQ